MSGFRTRVGDPIQGLKLEGSQVVASNGEINAHSNKELCQQIAKLIAAANNGDIQEVASVDREEASVKRREVLKAAYSSEGGDFADLGKELAAEVSLESNRSGLMRRLYKRAEVSQGNNPRIRVSEQNVMSIVATSPTVHVPQMVRSRHINPPEFYITASPSVEERDIAQTTDDLLEEAL